LKEVLFLVPVGTQLKTFVAKTSRVMVRGCIKTQSKMQHQIWKWAKNFRTNRNIGVRVLFVF